MLVHYNNGKYFKIKIILNFHRMFPFTKTLNDFYFTDVIRLLRCKIFDKENCITTVSRNCEINE